MQTQKLANKNEGIFLYLALLTGFFILLELSFFIECNKIYLYDYSFVSDKLHPPLTILPGIFFFVLVQFMLHAAYCFLIWCITILIANLWSWSGNKTIFLGISIWILGIAVVLSANHYFYPNSKFVMLTSLILFNHTVTKISLIVLLAVFSGLFFLALFQLLKTLLKKPWLFVLCFTTAAILGSLLFKSERANYESPATAERPNIILIGIDSLRPDFLNFFGYNNTTPFFDSFLAQASVFAEAVTPLARTFPSWTSILTGQYPRQIGVRSNLAKQDNLNLTNTLPAILQRQGYETIFATDETRFSNIDKNYGFDHIISPPMGLNDFLIGTFNDFPISNLLINTTVGKWLFPYSYANRPVYFAYEPNSFLKLIQPSLNKQRTKPLFLTIHFCLPHYPYLWASLPGNDFSVQERYVESIKRVDKQIDKLFTLLKRNHLLDHAIVVLLSDHGEALALQGDRITEKDAYVAKKAVPTFYPPGPDNEDINQSYGHGTDVLGLSQYHTLLAFKLYRVQPQTAHVIPGPVSLLDIKPTILDLLQIPSSKESLPGVSLADIIKGEQQSLAKPNHIFLESDFSPEAIRTVYPETQKVLLEGIELFQVDPKTTRLTVKDTMNQMIINSKQYADIYGEWMLALYPQDKHFRMPILINLVSGEWTNDLQSTFAQHSPALSMLAALRAFYGTEITKV